jgi:prepilin-type N-terminal cleavage/methylation domain-containing protein/prepilin-type processing-associated H-X9-DG protein
MKHHRAFTLIELLVVVAIVSLLLAILMPGLSQAREQAKQVKCGAHLRSFGVGFHTYAGSNRDALCSGSFDPEVSNDRDGPVDKVGWVADLVNGRLAFPQDQLCPSNPSRYNQKLGDKASGKDSYKPDQAQALIALGYNTNYTQSWYMARTECKPKIIKPKSVKGTLGPLHLSRWTLVAASRIPLIGDGRTDNDDLVLSEPAVKTLTDGPADGPYGTQNYVDFGPAHGFGSWIGGKKEHNRIRANILFADGSVRTYIDRDRDGEFGMITSKVPFEQKDLSEAHVFDGVLSIGRRSLDAYQIK